MHQDSSQPLGTGTRTAEPNLQERARHQQESEGKLLHTNANRYLLQRLYLIFLFAACPSPYQTNSEECTGIAAGMDGKVSLVSGKHHASPRMQNVPSVYGTLVVHLMCDDDP